MSFRWTCGVVSVGVLALIAASSRAEVPAPEKVTTVEGITEYRLGNGLKVLLFPDPSKPTVTVNVTYFVGSRHEGYGETGMAHLLEHMVFKGTPKHPEIWKEMRDHGAQFNGTTSYDRTNYFETCTATDENLEWALSLEADRMVNSHIAQKDLESEFSVVRNEFEQGENNPVGVLGQRIMSAAYLWHNYGKSTIGSREDIERVPIDRLQAFYRKYYQPDNAMLVVAGKFDEARTLKRINELFGAIPRPSRKLDATYTVEPAQDGEREVVLRRVGDVQAIGMVYHVCAAAHPDMAPLQVLADVMDATQTGRLYKALIDTRLATRVTARVASLHDPGVISFDVEVPLDKSLDAARKPLIEVVEGFAGTEVTDDEVERAKNAFQKNFDLLIAETGRVAIGLSNWAASGDWRLMFLHRDRMKKVTSEDVKRVARTYLKPTNRTIGVFTPTTEIERTIVPAAPDLAALLKDYRGEQAVAQGEDFDPTPQNIESRTTRTQTAGGVKLALLPKKTRGGRVTVNLTLNYGSEATLKGRTEAASVMESMLSRGTARHTQRQLQDEFDRLKAQVSVGGGGGGGRRGGGGGGGLGALPVSINCPRESLPAVLELVREILREPSFPADEFEKLHKQMLTAAENGRSEPRVLAGLALQRKLSPYPSDDIRYVPTIDERIARLKAVTLDEVKKVYADLLGASFVEAAAVGDFDASELTSALSAMLDGWKSPKPYERVAMPYHPVPAEHVVIDTPDKAMAIVSFGRTIELRDDDPDYPAATMANIVLGVGGNSRLLNRLRQKEGYSYGVSSMLSARSEDRSGVLMATAICAPENGIKAEQAATEEFERFYRDGVTQKELDDVRKGYVEQFKVGLSDDGAVTGMLARQLHLGRTMKFTQEQLAKIEALSLAEVNAAVKKYFDPSKLICVRAGDFGAPTPTPAAPGDPKD